MSTSTSSGKHKKKSRKETKDDAMSMFGDIGADAVMEDGDEEVPDDPTPHDSSPRKRPAPSVDHEEQLLQQPVLKKPMPSSASELLGAPTGSPGSPAPSTPPSRTPGSSSSSSSSSSSNGGTRLKIWMVKEPERLAAYAVAHEATDAITQLDRVCRLLGLPTHKDRPYTPCEVDATKPGCMVLWYNETPPATFASPAPVPAVAPLKQMPVATRGPAAARPVPVGGSSSSAGEPSWARF